jgi:hypothetical protein
VVEYTILGDPDAELTPSEQAMIERRYRRLGLGGDSSIIVSRVPVALGKPSIESKRRPAAPPKMLEIIRRKRLDPVVDVDTEDAPDAPDDALGLLEPPPAPRPRKEKGRGLFQRVAVAFGLVDGERH